MNQYETVFILTPVLSDVQMKEAVEKFKSILTAEGAEIVNEENKGMKRHFSFLIFHSLLKYGFFAKIISLVKELCFSL
jgi:type IV secretory pathway VirB4 component